MTFASNLVENLVLLAATAALTGVFAPWILKRVDERKAREQQARDQRQSREQKERDERQLREQKVFEAELSRQAKVIEAQSALLYTLADLLWKFQMSAIEVSYYSNAKDQSLYERALTKYEEGAGDLLAAIRAQVSRALHLTSHTTYEELKQLYYCDLLDLDKELHHNSESATPRWSQFNQHAVFSLGEKVDRSLAKLAGELRLTSTSSSANPSQAVQCDDDV